MSRRDVPVKVEHGARRRADLGDDDVDPRRSPCRAPASVVAKVVAVRADVTIQPAGSTSTRTSSSSPSTSSATRSARSTSTPPTARVTIPVFSDRQSRTLPVNPVITGTPAAGFEIESVVVDPQRRPRRRATPTQLAELTQVDTDADPDDRRVRRRDGRRSALALPTGVVAVGDGPVTVTITIRPVTATRTFNAGLRLVGAEHDLTYALSIDRVLVTIGGSTADLDRLSGRDARRRRST